MSNKFTGYYNDKDIPFKKGQTVEIPKGALLMTRKGLVEAKRSYTITVHHTLNGMSLPVGHKFRDNGEMHFSYTSRNDRETVKEIYGTDDLEALRDKMVEQDLGSPSHTVLYLPVSNPTICWPGAGGYWVDCDINQLV
jgi:hypothetical protein